MFVVKMSNGRGITEWYRSLAYRDQEQSKELARKFPTEEAAQTQARFCQDQASCFSGAYFDEGKGRYNLVATVESV